MKSSLIGGIGNVLLGDDGVGPYVVRLLESQYIFDEERRDRRSGHAGARPHASDCRPTG